MERTQAAAAIDKAKVTVIINVKALARDMATRLYALPATERYTFSRIAAYIRQENKTLYEPKSIAIGPYHHGSEHLQAMEKRKWLYLRDLLCRSTCRASLEGLLAKMQALEAPSRRLYTESITLANDEFVKMMVLDACFIIEFFWKFYEGNISNWQALEFTDMDLLLLENQIPFFIIKKLFKLVIGGGGGGKTGKTPPSLISLLYKYIMTMRIGMEKKTEIPPTPPEIHHLLHLYYAWFVPADTEAAGSPSMVKSNRYRKDVIPCFTELRKVGVRFRKKGSPCHMFGVTFKNGTMEIPPIPILDYTRPFFANLIAFEQTMSTGKMKMTSFSVLMDSLINSDKDVAILQRRNIIDNTLGSEQEVALFFNQLGRYVTVDPEDHYFAEIFGEVNRYRDSNWKRYWARLWHDYFSNPWSILSLLAALVLLALTFLQAFFAFYSNFHPPK